ncbi:hypothetical protein L618_003400000030 [Rhodococcus rhodochrous J45]|uniref:Uncharacterized protein n=1 Tax=Rhodococcus rhodochrous J45 TaxID=935266 RepID=A0A562DZJ4_RHORH|nr:hypothetical protein [Rhodococcus rhodochrous]TWH14987.1 hypothetical protein L618_003400000030 [Rhodococcus rhodochrous J45]
MTHFSAQDLLDSGARVICPDCNWLVVAGPACRKCGRSFSRDTAAPTQSAPQAQSCQRPPPVRPQPLMATAVTLSLPTPRSVA